MHTFTNANKETRPKETPPTPSLGVWVWVGVIFIYYLFVYQYARTVNGYYFTQIFYLSYYGVVSSLW